MSSNIGDGGCDFADLLGLLTQGQDIFGNAFDPFFDLVNALDCFGHRLLTGLGNVAGALSLLGHHLSFFVSLLDHGFNFVNGSRGLGNGRRLLMRAGSLLGSGRQNFGCG